MSQFMNKLKGGVAAATICRLCATLRKADCFLHIRDANLNLIPKLDRCCRLTIHDDDSLPQSVCVDCVQSLNKSWAFSEKVHEAQESLRALFGMDEVLVEVEEEEEEEVSEPKPNINDEINIIQIFEAGDIPHETPDSEDSQNAHIESIVIDNEEQANEGTDSEESVAENIELLIEKSEIVDEEEDNPTEIISVEAYNTWRDYKWSCTTCSVTFQGVEELREHVAQDHNDKQCSYVCVDCSKTYTKYYLFYNHVVTHRSHLKLYCDLCSERCAEPSVLAKHRETHTNSDKVALCSVCAKAFKDTRSLYAHIRSHKQDQMHQCEVCDKKFGTKPNLKAHQKIHFGVREFVCDQCGKDFIQKTNLEEHLITHINETPYECNECGKTFKTSSRLAKHKSIHSDVRPHKCEECGKEFREKDTLRVHKRIHTGAMPYACEYCDKRFRFRSILVTHRHQHTGVRPYSCLECNHHFTNWPNYNKHMKRRHGKTAGGKLAAQPDVQH